MDKMLEAEEAEIEEVGIAQWLDSQHSIAVIQEQGSHLAECHA